MKSVLFAATLLATLASPAFAQTAAAPAPAPAPAAGGNVLDRAINLPGTNWSVYGPNQKAKVIATKGVPGDQAMHVEVTAKGANPWDVGALSPIQKGIAAGDAILVAVYLRAPNLKEGETADISFLGATEAAEPYGNIAPGNVSIGKEWKLYYASGKSPKAYAPNTARVTAHLAGAKQVIELGPVFVLDFGPNYDLAKLPKN